MDRACIYHFSANTESWVCSKHIEEIKEFAEKNEDYIDHVYIDNSLKQSEKTEYIKMMNEADKYDNVYLRDAFHLNKWTLKAVADIRSLQLKGTKIFTMTSGNISVEEGREEYMNSKKVLFYHSKQTGGDKRSFEVQKMIVNLFCKENTLWEITDVIYEESDWKSVNAQPKLWQLGDISKEFDLMIVQSFARLDLRTARFEKLINQLGIDIYSMQEGMLKVRKE